MSDPLENADSDLTVHFNGDTIALEVVLKHPIDLPWGPAKMTGYSFVLSSGGILAGRIELSEFDSPPSVSPESPVMPT